MKYVCEECGSDRVFADAYMSMNDPGDVRVFDAYFCEDCEGVCSIKEVGEGGE